MSKNRIYLKSIGLCLILLSGFFSLFLSSCSEKPTPAEKLYVDTLHFKVKGDLKALNIDANELQARKEEIINTMYPAIQDTFPEIKEKLEDDFYGMRSAYDAYLNKHLLLLSATKLLLAEVEEFRAQADEDNLSREEFKNTYQALNARVEANSKSVEEIAKPVYELEPMWMRLKLKFAPTNAKIEAAKE